VPPELQPKFEQINEFVEQRIIVDKMIVQQNLVLQTKEYESLRDIALENEDFD